MNRAWMDRFIDTIEWIAAAFVGIVALNIFLAVILKIPVFFGIWLIWWAARAEPEIAGVIAICPVVNGPSRCLCSGGGNW